MENVNYNPSSSVFWVVTRRKVLLKRRFGTTYGYIFKNQALQQEASNLSVKSKIKNAFA